MVRQSKRVQWEAPGTTFLSPGTRLRDFMKRLQVIHAGCLALAICTVMATTANAGHHGAACCAPDPCCEPCCAPAPEPCCPAPPVTVSWCVTDPVTCCTHQVSACLPAECAGEVPCYVGCRRGFLGRRILTYKFACGECVEVVITHFGRVIVR